jgi:hypothetical protein
MEEPIVLVACLAEEFKMPYSFNKIGEEPKKLILHRSEILRWIGVSSNMFAQVRKDGLLPWKRILPGGHRYYLKSDVKKVFLTNFRT